MQGCVDNYKKCAEWSRAGVCSQRPEFMSFHCRESCGTCGFKSCKFQNVTFFLWKHRTQNTEWEINWYCIFSASNSMDQVVNGKQYTTDNHKAFSKNKFIQMKYLPTLGTFFLSFQLVEKIKRRTNSKMILIINLTPQCLMVQFARLL